jgi:ASC-1-like (ASCH) protein
MGILKLSFKEYLYEEKNTHMTHIQDLVLYKGVKGTEQAIKALREVYERLRGNKSSSVDISVKFDGSPAVFCGQDPTDGQFFVAKKGIFNKNPKVYKSHADIDADTSGDLNTKLKVAFDELKDIGIKGIIQGDIMFTKKDLKRETIDGRKYITFHPNTIIYAVPADIPLAKTISAANIGIVFHTTYTGTTFENLTASYGVNLSGLKNKRTVWMRDAEYRDQSGQVLLSKNESRVVEKAIQNAEQIFRKISRTALRDIAGNREIAATIEQYNNSFVRAGKPLPANSDSHVRGLIKWLGDRFDKEALTKKSDKGKAAVSARRDSFMEFFSEDNRKNLALVFDLQKAMIEAKLILIEKLDRLSELNTFVKTRQGFQVTKSEGFVAIDRLSGGAVKLVDQLSFSYNNFSPDIIKAWQ